MLIPLGRHGTLYIYIWDISLYVPYIYQYVPYIYDDACTVPHPYMLIPLGHHGAPYMEICPIYIWWYVHRASPIYIDNPGTPWCSIYIYMSHIYMMARAPCLPHICVTHTHTHTHTQIRKHPNTHILYLVNNCHRPAVWETTHCGLGNHRSLAIIPIFSLFL